MTQAEEIKVLKEENAALKEALRIARDYLLQLKDKQEDSLAMLRLNPDHLPFHQESE